MIILKKFKFIAIFIFILFGFLNVNEIRARPHVAKKHLRNNEIIKLKRVLNKKQYTDTIHGLNFYELEVILSNSSTKSVQFFYTPGRIDDHFFCLNSKIKFNSYIRGRGIQIIELAPNDSIKVGTRYTTFIRDSNLTTIKMYFVPITDLIDRIDNDSFYELLKLKNKIHDRIEINFKL